VHPIAQKEGSGVARRSRGARMELKESDWKRFRNSLEKWRERYLKWKNDEMRSILEERNRNETEKFWDIVEFQKKEAKILSNCLDGYSRSSMTSHMALMMKYKMIDQDDVEEFSEELQEFLERYKNL
jgi:hypothetical protein